MARAKTSTGHTVKEVFAAYAGHRLRELRGPDEKVAYQKIADDVGITKPQTFDLINFAKGYGPKVEQAIAEKFFDGSVDALHHAAAEWYAKQVVQTHTADRYFAMEAVRAMAEKMNYPAPFMKTFEAELDLDGQPSADDLWTICKAEYAKWKGKRVESAANPLDDIDVQTSRKKR